ncbi:MAG: glycosyltransferase family 2 protein [Bdellovibrionota bacterium]
MSAQPTTPEDDTNERRRTKPRRPISAFVICFNEEEHIADCLRSLDFCDEVLVIDSFSKDRTVEIAMAMGAKVIQRAWPGYRDQKAFGLTVVAHEWVINIDADERVSPELRESILNILESDEISTAQRAIAGYYVNRVVFYLGRWWRKGGWYPEYRLRVFRKHLVTWGGVEPHEKPIVQGETGTLPGELQHFTYKNMDEQLSRLHKFSSIAARAEFEAGGRSSVLSLLLNPILRMLKFYVLKKGYREGMAGFVVAGIEGYYTFMKYAKLWEIQYMLDKEWRPAGSPPYHAPRANAESRSDVNTAIEGSVIGDRAAKLEMSQRKEGQ